MKFIKSADKQMTCSLITLVAIVRLTSIEIFSQFLVVAFHYSLYGKYQVSR